MSASASAALRGGIPGGRWNHGVRLEALANLAHELRSPVQALVGYLEILRDDLGEDLQSTHKQIIDRMNVNVYDLAQTVENVMDFAVADALAETGDEQDIRPHDLLTEILPTLEAANGAKGLHVTFDFEGAPPVFRTRPRAIKAILLNLAVNAIKFTENGSVTIAIRRLKSRQLGPCVELMVSDTGPGIDAPHLARMFKRCAQLSASSVRSHRGMGLGLAVVQRNAELLGAKIKVNTARGKGSSFSVTIPIAKRPARNRSPRHRVRLHN